MHPSSGTQIAKNNGLYPRQRQWMKHASKVHLSLGPNKLNMQTNSLSACGWLSSGLAISSLSRKSSGVAMASVTITIKLAVIIKRIFIEFVVKLFWCLSWCSHVFIRLTFLFWWFLFCDHGFYSKINVFIAPNKISITKITAKLVRCKESQKHSIWVTYIVLQLCQVDFRFLTLRPIRYDMRWIF